MKWNLILLIFVPLIGHSQYSGSQQLKIDSINQLIHSNPHATTLANSYNEFSEIMFVSTVVANGSETTLVKTK